MMRSMKKIIPAMLALAIVFAAGSLAAGDNSTHKESLSMRVHAAQNDNHVDIPPIDARVPQELAVAVFGMG